MGRSVNRNNFTESRYKMIINREWFGNLEVMSFSYNLTDGLVKEKYQFIRIHEDDAIQGRNVEDIKQRR